MDTPTSCAQRRSCWELRPLSAPLHLRAPLDQSFSVSLMPDWGQFEVCSYLSYRHYAWASYKASGFRTGWSLSGSERRSFKSNAPRDHLSPMASLAPKEVSCRGSEQLSELARRYGKATCQLQGPMGHEEAVCLGAEGRSQPDCGDASGDLATDNQIHGSQHAGGLVQGFPAIKCGTVAVKNLSMNGSWCYCCVVRDPGASKNSIFTDCGYMRLYSQK